jgi:hypothetical protein
MQCKRWLASFATLHASASEQPLSGNNSDLMDFRFWPGVELNDSYCARQMPFHRISPSQLFAMPTKRHSCTPSCRRRPSASGHLKTVDSALSMRSVALEIILAHGLAEIVPLTSLAEVVHQAEVAQEILEARVGAQAGFIWLPQGDVIGIV